MSMFQKAPTEAEAIEKAIGMAKGGRMAIIYQHKHEGDFYVYPKKARGYTQKIVAVYIDGKKVEEVTDHESGRRYFRRKTEKKAPGRKKLDKSQKRTQLYLSIAAGDLQYLGGPAVATRIAENAWKRAIALKRRKEKASQEKKSQKKKRPK